MSTFRPGTGHKRGERHHRTRHSNKTVERARQLHDEGWGYGSIGKMLGGISADTVRDWCAYRTRSAA